MKEGNVLFNDALNTFYLRLYGVRHMVKDHSDSERGNPLPPHRLLFLISSKGFYMHHPTQNTYHSLCYTSHGALAGTRNSSMGPLHEGSIRWPSHHERTLLPWSSSLLDECGWLFYIFFRFLLFYKMLKHKMVNKEEEKTGKFCGKYQQPYASVRTIQILLK